ncbi:MAG: LIC_12708 family protein [Spirochaetaceae bacterium]
MRLPILRIAGIVCAAFVFLSCGPREIRYLERQDLFSLSLGRSEDQIDLFQVDSADHNRRARVFMRQGLVYLADGSANKIMEFNSYGDILSLVYNPEENPQPVLLRSNPDNETLANRRAVGYNFTEVGEIAVTSESWLLVEDRLAEERALFDENLGVTLNRIVLRFGPEGRLVDYLGQEGVGGTPFPVLSRLTVTNRDEAVVVSRTLRNWMVFWYDRRGNLLYRADIDLNRLPVPEESEGIIPLLETIIPDRDEARLYLKINYYQESVDTGTGSSYGIESTASRIYWLDLNEGVYSGFVEVPENVRTVPGPTVFDRSEQRYLYELVGTASGGHLFLLSREDQDQTQLLIMHTSGRVVRRRYLSLEETDILYRDFHVSPEGVLTALFGYTDHAKVVWWRSDRFLGRGTE